VPGERLLMTPIAASSYDSADGSFVAASRNAAWHAHAVRAGSRHATRRWLLAPTGGVMLRGEKPTVRLAVSAVAIGGAMALTTIRPGKERPLKRRAKTEGRRRPTPLRIAIVLGQAAPAGRLARAASGLEGEIQKLRAEAAVSMIDLSATPLEPCDGRPLDAYRQTTRDAVEAIGLASAVVLCSPVYRASFPGVLKNLLDLLPVEALRDKPVAIVAMGASDHHYLGVDGHLRLVLAWFGAIVLPTSVYLKGTDFTPDGIPAAQTWETLSTLCSSLIDLTERVRGASFGPPPLAAKV
jgi:FMN reductase